MALTHCKECRAQISTAAKTCPSCGVPAPGHRISKTLGSIALVVLSISFVRAFLIGDSEKPTQSTAPSPITFTTAHVSPPAPAAAPLIQVDASATLARGRAMDAKLAEANRPNKVIKDMVLVKKDEYESVRRDLFAIGEKDVAYQEAQKIIASFDRREEEAKIGAQKALAKAVADDSKGRETYAKEFEKTALMAGFSVTVWTSGPKSTVLNLKYPALTKASIYQITNDGTFQRTLAAYGFTKMVAQDGYNWTGHVDLSPLNPR